MLSKFSRFVHLIKSLAGGGGIPPKAGLFNWVKKYQEELILFVGVILISLFSFAIGYITADKQQKGAPIKFEQVNKNNLCE